MKTHKDLDIWKKSIDFVTLIYKTTANFPNNEIYGITGQIRRSAVSIPSNIAEGAARTSLKEFDYFLSVSLGSISEIETQLIISQNLEYINHDHFIELDNKLTDIRKMVLGLKKSLADRK